MRIKILFACKECLHSKDRSWDGAVDEVVDDQLKVLGHTSRCLVLKEAWNHASRVHLDRVLNLDTAIIGLPAHVGDNVVGNYIAANLRGLRASHERIVTLA